MNRRLVTLRVCLALAVAVLIWTLVQHDGSRELTGNQRLPVVASERAGHVANSNAAESAASASSVVSAVAVLASPAIRSALESLPADLRERVRHFEDASVPVTTRLAELADLAKKGDAASAPFLMVLGNEHTYLNYAAVQALGSVKAADVTEYLTGKLADPDPRVVCAAVKSLVRQRGEAAVEDLAATVKANRRRPDGFEDTVCAACAEALGDTRSAKAVPVLEAELKETVGVTLQYEYGSQVVKALAATGRMEARPVLLAYAERLSRDLTKYDDNLMGKRFIEGKIAEARQAAESLGSP